MIGMVESIVERAGRSSTARRHHPSSADLDAPTFARAVRAHWGIENRLHGMLDVVFHDDLMRLRIDGGPANMEFNRHAALNLIKVIPDEASLRIRRKTLGWDDDHLRAAINAPQP